MLLRPDFPLPAWLLTESAMIWQNFYIWEGPFSDRTESARFKSADTYKPIGEESTHEARTCYRTADSEPAGLHAAGQCPGGGGDVWCVCRRAGPDHDGGGPGRTASKRKNAADIDGTQYATLAEAVAQAEEGATIRLLRDVELTPLAWSTARER